MKIACIANNLLGGSIWHYVYAQCRRCKRLRGQL